MRLLVLVWLGIGAQKPVLYLRMTLVQNSDMSGRSFSPGDGIFFW